MLYDPNWKKEVVKVKPSLEGLIAFLRTKDPDEKYNYYNHTKCAAAQYYESIGTSWDKVREDSHKLLAEINSACAIGPRNSIPKAYPTFGEALENALQEAGTR